MPLGTRPRRVSKKSWGLFLFAGIVGVVLGFVVLSWRTETLNVLRYFAGAAFLFVGIVRLVETFVIPARRLMSLFSSVVFLAVGVILLVWPNITLYIAALLIAIGFLMWSLLEFIVAFSDVHARHWWLHLIGGIVSLVISVWTVRHPGHALNVLVILIGIWIMLWGVVEIVAAFVARHARRHWEALKAAA